MSDYLREVLKAIRGLSHRGTLRQDARPSPGLSLTDRELLDLSALVQLVCEVLDDGHVLALAFCHHLRRHGVADTATELDHLRGFLSKAHLRADKRLSLVMCFHRSGMKKSQFLRDVMKIRPEDEGEQRRYLDRALKEFAGIDKALIGELDKMHIKKS